MLCHCPKKEKNAQSEARNKPISRRLSCGEAETSFMGGKKKLTLKQMERAADKKDETAKRGGKSGGPAPEKKAPGIVPPDIKSDKVLGEIKKMKAVTPFTVASRFNLRLSVARDMLDELAQRGIIDYVSGSKNIKIYRPHD